MERFVITMPHFCSDELLMLLSFIPLIGFWFAKLHAWYHVKFGHRCHHAVQCPETHLEHLNKKDTPVIIVSEKDAEYLRGEPVPLIIKIPVKIEDEK